MPAGSILSHAQRHARASVRARFRFMVGSAAKSPVDVGKVTSQEL